MRTIRRTSAFKREKRRRFKSTPNAELASVAVDHPQRKDCLVTLSLQEYERPKRRDRRALAIEELSDAEVEAIRSAEPPSEAERYDHEFTHERGADS